MCTTVRSTVAHLKLALHLQIQVKDDDSSIISLFVKRLFAVFGYTGYLLLLAC